MSGRVTGLLEEVVGEVVLLAQLDDLVDPFEPALDVEQLRGSLAANVVIQHGLEPAVVDQVDLAAEDLFDEPVDVPKRTSPMTRRQNVNVSMPTTKAPKVAPNRRTPFLQRRPIQAPRQLSVQLPGSAL